MISGKTACGLQYAVRKSTSAVGYCALSIKCGTRDEMKLAYILSGMEEIRKQQKEANLKIQFVTRKIEEAKVAEE